MPEVAASGDAGSADMHMGPTNVHMGTASAEVTPGQVSAAQVTSAEVASTTEVTAASVSATSMTASATSKGHCRDCRTAQQDSGGRYEQCFSQHQNLHHIAFRAPNFTGAFFPSSTRPPERSSSTTNHDLHHEEIESEYFRCK
jgi:hypothetical protein